MNKSLIGIVLGIGAAATALCAKIYYDERDQPEVEDETEEELKPDPEEAYREPDFTMPGREFEFDESLFREPDSYECQDPEEESYIHFEQELEPDE